jgi:hypothetical protein
MRTLPLKEMPVLRSRDEFLRSFPMVRVILRDGR